MALAIIGFFEDLIRDVSSGWPSAWMDQWLLGAKAMGCTNLGMIDVSSYQTLQYYAHADLEISYQRWTSLEDCEATLASWTRIYLAPKQDLIDAGYSYTELQNYTHPTVGNQAYIFGPNSGIPDILTGRGSEIWVSVPTADDLEPYSGFIAGAVMWDRFKQGL